ncbi:MAG: tetratricopeptide repeat protein [Planctomycetota bacterium]
MGGSIDLAWHAISPGGREGLGQLQVHGATRLEPDRVRALAVEAFTDTADASASPQDLERSMGARIQELLPEGAVLERLRIEVAGRATSPRSAPRPAAGPAAPPGFLARALSGLASALFKLALAAGLLAAAAWGGAQALTRARSAWSAPSTEQRSEAGQRYRDGLEQLSRGAYAEAVESLAKALELDPQDTAAHEARGRALLKLGRYGEARGDLDVALTAAKGELALGLLVLRAEARLLSDDPSGALADAQQVLAKHADLADANWHAARALLALERYAEALPLLDKVVSARPEDNAVRFRRGLARHHLKDFEGAIDDYEAVLLALPKHRLAKQNLDRAKLGEAP